jgi:hypothetical protein
MPKVLYVTRTYEVNIPDDRTAIHAAIERDNLPGDAAIIKGSDEAIAVFMSYKYDIGNVDNVEILDGHVKDIPPDVEEFDFDE